LANDGSDFIGADCTVDTALSSTVCCCMRHLVNAVNTFRNVKYYFLVL